MEYTKQERMNYYYMLGKKLGKAVVKKGRQLETRYRNYVRNPHVYPTTREKFNELVELMIIADLYIPNLQELLTSSDEEKNTVINLILNTAMKPIAESKHK